jgi:RimJ/RimL family protein N-acetyltransferase
VGLPPVPITTRVALRGGRVALIGPLDPDDRERFLRGMGRASPDSMYKRFMTPLPRLSSTQLAYLLEVDHRDHEALLAIDEDSGEAVAVARFVRLEESPSAAELAVLVIDDWHGLGLAKAICWLLAERAGQLGIERFEATMLSDNRAMKRVFESLGEIQPVAREGATVTFTVRLPDGEFGECMSDVLRPVGEDEYELGTPADAGPD